MNKYKIVYYGLGGIFSEDPIIEGKTGVAALSNYYPNKVGIFKVCHTKDCEYMLRRIVTIDGKDYTINRRVGYRYIEPRFEKVTNYDIMMNRKTGG